ncbi:MAG: NAD(P)H-hydrate dehydratase [Bacteroidetes bacterium]|nr:NAD(P)H-hydrate dehydratase [Bacteroidota bacterium]
MKILDAEQLGLFDENLMKRQQITSEKLMWRAASGCVAWLLQHDTLGYSAFDIFCGTGNNGGDGLSIGLQLHRHGYCVRLHIVAFSQNYSADFTHYFKQVAETDITVSYITEKDRNVSLANGSLVIDAIFGYGLNRPPESWVQHLFEYINRTAACVVSIDLPSGLFAHKNLTHTCICAHYTLTFAFPKLSMLLPETGKFVGKWQLISLYETPADHSDLQSDFHLLTSENVLKLRKLRPVFSHKGTYGHALIAGGSYGKIGAVLLAARAALKSGCGLVSVYVPKCGYLPFQTALQEVMVETDAEKEFISNLAPKTSFSSVGLGMGLGLHTKTADALCQFLKNQTKPLVIDADGLNILSKHPEWLALVPKNSLLTPHPKELERLIGSWVDDFEKLSKSRDFAKKHQWVILIKGAHTAIVDKNGVWFNHTGNSGMATAGSGDVLAGILTSLLAQGYQTLDAAKLGVWIHGLAADIAIQENESPESLSASDIINHLGKAFNSMND